MANFVPKTNKSGGLGTSSKMWKEVHHVTASFDTVSLIEENSKLVVKDGPLSTQTVDVTGHDGATDGLKLGGTLVTATATQINTISTSDVLDDLNTLGAPASDGQFIVATGAGAFSYEDGATARTSLGLGTGDSPEFTSLTLSGQSSPLNLNSNRLVNLATPVSASDAATKSYVDIAIEGLDIKESVRVATTAAVTLSSDLENGDTIDDITLATGDRILVKDQATSSENGIYIVQASGAPSRSDDLSASDSAAGVFVFVEEGTTNADKGFVCTSDNGSDVVGTDSLSFTQFSGASGGISNLVEDTTPQLGGALDINSQTITGHLIPTTTDTHTLGSASSTWRDLYLGDSGYIYFGEDQDVQLNHTADSGLTLKMGTAQGSEPVLTLQNSVDSQSAHATLRFRSYTTSPASGDTILKMQSIAPNSVAGIHYYSDIITKINSATDGSEAAKTELHVATGGNFSGQNSGTIGLTLSGDSSGNVESIIPNHDGSNSGLVLGSTLLTATAEELNILDTSVVAPNDADVLTYTVTNGTGSLGWSASSGGGISNLVEDTTPQLGGTLDINSQTITGNLIPTTTNTHVLGSTSSTWGDLYLGDSSKIYFGEDQDVFFEHNPDTGLTLDMGVTEGNDEPTLKLVSQGSSATRGPSLNLFFDKTAPTTSEKLGQIIFSGRDSGGALAYYGKIGCIPTEDTDGSETAKIYISPAPASGYPSLPGLTVEGVTGDNTKAIISVTNHNGTDSGLKLGSTLLTATAEELNILDTSVAAPNDADVLTYTVTNGTGSLGWSAASGGAGISNLVEDTTPQLGGTLDINSQAILGSLVSSTSNTYDLGSTSSTWGDLYLGDSSKIYFGEDQDVFLEHDPDNGLMLDLSTDQAAEPVFTLKTAFGSGAAGSTIKFLSESPSSSSGDIIATISAKGNTSVSSLHDYADIRVKVENPTNNIEAGGIYFYSATSGLPAGNLSTEGLKIIGNSSGHINVDVPLHDGANSGLNLGGTLITATAAELNILDTSVATPSNNDDVLTYSGGSLQWAAAAGGGGASAPAVTTYTGSTDYSISTSTGIEEVFLLNPTTTITASLPSASTAGSGYKYQIKNLSTSSIIVEPSGSQTVDTATNFGITNQYSSITIVSDGSNWFII